MMFMLVEMEGGGWNNGLKEKGRWYSLFGVQCINLFGWVCVIGAERRQNKARKVKWAWPIM